MIKVNKIIAVIAIAALAIQLNAMEQERSINSQLWIAANEGRLAEVQALLQRGGADQKGLDDALRITILQGYRHPEAAQIAQLLIVRGANKAILNSLDHDGLPILRHPLKNNKKALVRVLFENGANPNQKNDETFSLLMLLTQAAIGESWASSRYANILAGIELLIEYGGDPKAVVDQPYQFEYNIKKGDTVLHVATSYTMPQLVRILVGTIPLAEQEKIRKNFNKIVALRLHGQPFNKDLRKLIIQELINSLVDDQIARIRPLLEMKNAAGKMAFELTSHPEKQQLLDPESPMLRDIFENKIRQILFSRPVVQEKPHSNLEEQTVKEEDPLGEF